MMEIRQGDKPLAQIRLYGGLGNQIFQYAFGTYLFQENLARVCFDANWLVHLPSHNKSDIRNFQFSKNLDFCRSLSKSDLLVEDLLNKVSRRSKSAQKILGIRFECEFEELKSELNNHKFKFRGYYQNLSFPPSVFEHLRSLEWQPIKPSIEFLRIEKSFEKKQFIGIHVRGGDYISSKSIYAQLDESYYLEALESLNFDFPNIPKLVFTNDKPLAQKLLPTRFQYEYISDLGLTDSEEFVIFMKAKAHVIANSTFSYWVGIISNSTEVVIAPRRWYEVDKYKAPYIPKNWRII